MRSDHHTPSHPSDDHTDQSRRPDAATRLRFRQDYATELSDDYYGSYNFNCGYYLGSLPL